MRRILKLLSLALILLLLVLIMNKSEKAYSINNTQQMQQIKQVQKSQQIKKQKNLQEAKKQLKNNVNDYFSDSNQRSNEKPSPYDRIKEDRIHVYNDKVIIEIKNASWARFTDTNSMDPVLDKEANAIQIKPKTKQEIHLGDIITYKDVSGEAIIHRVVYIGSDKDGWYSIVKGDNNKKADPIKVRFNQITKVVVAIIY